MSDKVMHTFVDAATGESLHTLTYPIVTPCVGDVVRIELNNGLLDSTAQVFSREYLDNLRRMNKLELTVVTVQHSVCYGSNALFNLQRIYLYCNVTKI